MIALAAAGFATVVLVVVLGAILRLSSKQVQIPAIANNASIYNAQVEQSMADVELPTYTPFDEQVIDTPIKAEVRITILVSGSLTEAGLRNLLNKLATSALMRTGFKYHTTPTHLEPGDKTGVGLTGRVGSR